MKFKSLSLSFAFAGLVLASATAVLAYPNEKCSPFPPDARPEQIKLHEFNGGKREINSDGEIQSLVFKDTVDGQVVEVRLTDDGDGTLLLDYIVDGEAKVAKVPVASVGNWFFSVVSGDLNQDGIEDYIIDNWQGGNGWAAGGEVMTFVLSTGQTYKTTAILANYPRTENFVILGGKPCFIHTSIGEVGDSERKIVEYYYVHNILVFDGVTIHVDNSLYPGFPMIQSDYMMFNGDAEPEPVKSVLDGMTKAQKDELRQKALREIF